MARLVLLLNCLISTVFLNNIQGQNINDTISAFTVINRSIEAQGGKTLLASIQSFYVDQKTTMEGREVHWVTKEMTPNKGSFEIIYNTRSVYRTWFDGENGYEINNGKKVKTKPEEYKDKKYVVHIFTELDYLDSSIWKIELAGEGIVENDTCYKIKVTLANGTVKMEYYSKTSYLERKKETLLNGESNRFSVFIFSGFRKFGGLIYPTETKYGNADKLEVTKVSTLAINRNVEENDFK
jgi:hypothetical protein